ncbi:acetate--CoA ligase family protein [Candidatus Woesearchaeota archaeon]|nr:acetate--CoA ligase family protein [Candidatus Woesearchaeota archaeon]
MKLYEFEGMQIFAQTGIAIPQQVVIQSIEELEKTYDLLRKGSVVVKAQTLAGKRGKAGAIKFCDTKSATKNAIKQMLNKAILNETATKLIVAEKLTVKKEYYLGLIFSQELRSPVLILSTKGGIDIEETEKLHPEIVHKFPINILEGIDEKIAKQFSKTAQFQENEINELARILVKFYKAFSDFDMKMAEINPLIKTKENKFIAADAVIVLDEAAEYRYKIKFPQRMGIGRELTPIEIAAKKIDEEDYRGVAGRTYIDLDGDIGVLASGGGASITCVDALISYGGKPANYTEYSGNPSAEKVEKLARVVLSKKELNGLWIIGGTANFTRIDITIGGIIKALKEIKPKFPIVVRRGGQGEKEAFAMLNQAAKDYGLDISCYDDTTPMTVSAKILADKVRNYKERCRK